MEPEKITITCEDTPKCRIVFLTMVKNESKIIQRCLESAANFVDAFVICDTGSTDNTIELAQSFIEKTGKTGVIAKHEWRNFGHNRTLSFRMCQDFVRTKLGWNLSDTYCLLLDGDMVFRSTPQFSKECLSGAGYSIIQKAGSLHYYNARLLRLSDSWTCVGATHEYWSGPGTTNLSVDTIWIDDLNDGGAKSDKFVRDARLLEAERDEQPNNGRTWFYLAQTYKDLGRFDEAIKAYEKRIEIGGWREEVWYSHYMIAKIYALKCDIAMAEMWGNRGIAFHGIRSEIHYLLTRIFRERGEHFKAWHYYQRGHKIPFPDDVLFVETNVYGGLFTYEASILHYYCFPRARAEGLRLSIDYLNGSLDENKENVWNNLPFYIERLPEKRVTPFPFESLGLDKDVWRMSSGSVVKLTGDCSGQLLVNMRHVNYNCSERGEYNSRDSDGIVRTRNAWLKVHDTSVEKSEEFMKDELGLPEYRSHIQGLEDIRLWHDSDTGIVYFTAAAMDRVEEQKYRIISGKYDWKAGKLTNGRVLVPPTNTQCEKNWIQLGTDSFIYKWSPLTICNGNGNFISDLNQIKTPWIFSKFRGSCGPCRMSNGNLLFLCHSVHYGSPRKYFHYLVVLEPTSYSVVKWSLPFSFTGCSIEYCTGMVLDVQDNPLFIVSRFDKNPVAIRARIAKDFNFVVEK
ncbi:MAG: tetratricopeptide repeat protein [Actinobacteria bacterium]|nr:tetratricopeptide repeat protein [Actinomycetota bacterium]NDG26835.1 tetratricopeptide repeat protein [Pseudomonadota bacterium]